MSQMTFDEWCKPLTGECEECGKPTRIFESSGRVQRCCSRACSLRLQRRTGELPKSKKPKECPICGDTGGRNCPNAMCQWMMGKSVPRACRWCKSWFMPRIGGSTTAGTGLYCSNVCGHAWRRGASTECKFCGLVGCACGQHSKVSWLNCKACGVVFGARTLALYCSQCRHTPKRWRSFGECRCVECGETWVAETHASSRRFCSRQCAKRKMRRDSRRRLGNQSKNHRKRARKFGVEYEPISMKRLTERDGSRCGLCHRKVRRTKDVNADCYPNLDHIIPMSKGGGHVWGNVQLLCRACNMKKSDGMEVGTQLRLSLTPT